MNNHINKILNSNIENNEKKKQLYKLYQALFKNNNFSSKKVQQIYNALHILNIEKIKLENKKQTKEYNKQDQLLIEIEEKQINFYKKLMISNSLNNNIEVEKLTNDIKDLSLNKYTVKQLHKIAKDNKIKKYSGLRKNKLILLLKGLNIN